MTTTDVVPGEQVSVAFLRRFANDYLAAWNSHDPQRLLALADPQVRWEDPYIPTGRLEGHDELREWLEATWRGLPDLTFRTDGDLHLATDGRSAMVAWTGVGTLTGPLVPPGFAPTGQRVEMAGADTYWFREHRLVRVRTYSDTTAVARQIGAAPEPGTVAERVGVVVQRVLARRRRRNSAR